MSLFGRLMGRGVDALAPSGHIVDDHPNFVKLSEAVAVDSFELGVKATINTEASEIVLTRMKDGRHNYPFVVEKEDGHAGVYDVDVLVHSLGNAFNSDTTLVREDLPWSEAPESLKELTRRALDNGMTIELRSKGD